MAFARAGFSTASTHSNASASVGASQAQQLPPTTATMTNTSPNTTTARRDEREQQQQQQHLSQAQVPQYEEPVFNLPISRIRSTGSLLSLPSHESIAMGAYNPRANMSFDTSSIETEYGRWVKEWPRGQTTTGTRTANN